MFHKRSGFTLMEILVAMVLLAIVGLSALSSFSSSTQISTSKNNTAYNIARGKLEQLYEYVRQDTWGNNNVPLAVTGPTVPGTNPQTLDGKTYAAAYTVTSVDQDVNGQEDYRRVRMTITW